MNFKNSYESMIQVIKSVTDNEIMAVPTFLSMDLNGNLMIESFNQLMDYDEEEISVKAGSKVIYINGKDLKIRSFSKSNLHISGDIRKIEIFEVK